ncbi:MAG: PHP domain-containing protein [Clostridia bacterium]|nr:PHP domain-containing protein [Clostridia bacterium]
MNRYYYDLHIHSTLSPCADDDNTPNNIAGMAKLSGLDIVALTDHNSTKNCPAFFEAAERYGLIPIAGMELTTSEDIHMVCLFSTLEDAMRFGEEVSRRLIKVKNRPEIFGEQLILDGEDNVIGKEEMLLSVATDISVEALPELVGSFGGICYPAHIDRDANGIIAVLGTLPDSPVFNTVELRDREKIDEYTERYGLSDKRIVIDSDAHCLTDMRDGECYFELESPREDPRAVVAELINILR